MFTFWRESKSPIVPEAFLYSFSHNSHRIPGLTSYKASPSHIPATLERWWETVSAQRRQSSYWNMPWPSHVHASHFGPLLTQWPHRKTNSDGPLGHYDTYTQRLLWLLSLKNASVHPVLGIPWQIGEGLYTGHTHSACEVQFGNKTQFTNEQVNSLAIVNMA